MSRIPENVLVGKHPHGAAMFILVWHNKRRSWPTQTVWPELLRVYLRIKPFSYLSFCFLTNLSVTVIVSFCNSSPPPGLFSLPYLLSLLLSIISALFFFFLLTRRLFRRPRSLIAFVSQILSLYLYKNIETHAHLLSEPHTCTNHVATSKFGSKKVAIRLRQTLSA